MARQAKKLQNKTKTHSVIPLDHDTFEVTSGSSGSRYLVRLHDEHVGGGQCNCKWGQYRKHSDFYRSGCSHVQAVYRHLENLAGRETSTWANKEAAQRQHQPKVYIGDDIWMTSRKNSSVRD